MHALWPMMCMPTCLATSCIGGIDQHELAQAFAIMGKRLTDEQATILFQVHVNAHMYLQNTRARARARAHTHTVAITRTQSQTDYHLTYTQKNDADGGGSIDVDEFRHMVMLSLGKYCDADCVSCTKCDPNNQVQQTL